MRKYVRAVPLLLASGMLAGCGIFPKEEELRKTPIIQAYEQEPFRTVKVEKGDLKLYEKLEAVCMPVGETQYSFKVGDRAFKAIYVEQGQEVQAGTLLAELVDTSTATQTASAQQLQLTAEEGGVVTFVKELEDAERSVAGQIVAIVNSTKGYYLNGFTKYWKQFELGAQMTMSIRGKEYQVTVVQAEDLGLSPTVYPQDPEEPAAVYLYLEDSAAYLQSGDRGEVTILADERTDVLYIPKGAVTTVNDKQVVYVEDKDGIRSAKYIETGLETDRYVEVTSGLEQGDSIILE